VPDLVVQVRAEGGDGYGVVPVQRQGGAPHVLLDPGPWRLFIDDGTNLRMRRIRVDGSAVVEMLEDVPRAAPAQVQGNVEGGEGLRVLWQRREDGRLVLAHGFVLPTGSGGRYRGRLPAGTYEVVVENLRGQRSPPRKVELTPGMQLSLPLRAP
jgi:hypothetical protein